MWVLFDCPMHLRAFLIATVKPIQKEEFIFNETLHQATIVRSDYQSYLADCNNQIYRLKVSGRFHYQALNKDDYPAVGDHVLFRPTNDQEGIIERVEARRSVLKRLARTNVHDAQILAANVDVAFLCLSMNEDFHPRKLANLITMTRAEGVRQVVLLTKTDLTDNPETYVEQAREVTDLPVVTVSVLDDASVETIRTQIGTDTVVFIGSSGVGKSTLINTLFGEDHFVTKDIRSSDAQGRHATTHRELVRLNSGGAIIDTPGMRELDSYRLDDLDDAFNDIAELANQCRFRDCQHDEEPNCAVWDAIEQGDLDPMRLEQYRKAERINAYVKRKEHEKERLQQRRQHNR